MLISYYLRIATCACLVSSAIIAQVPTHASGQGTALTAPQKIAVCKALDELKCIAKIEVDKKCKKIFEEAVESVDYAKANLKIRYDPAVDGAITSPDTTSENMDEYQWGPDWGNIVRVGVMIQNSGPGVLGGALGHEGDHFDDDYDLDPDGRPSSWSDACAKAHEEVRAACLEGKILHALRDKAFQAGAPQATIDELDERIKVIQGFKLMQASLFALMSLLGLC